MDQSGLGHGSLFGKKPSLQGRRVKPSPSRGGLGGDGCPVSQSSRPGRTAASRKSIPIPTFPLKGKEQSGHASSLAAAAPSSSSNSLDSSSAAVSPSRLASDLSDRQRDVWGKRGRVRDDTGGGGIIKT